MSRYVGLALIAKGTFEDLQVWKVDRGVCFFGIVVGKEAGIGKRPPVDVVNDHYSDLM